VSDRGYLDTLGMWEAAAALPEELRAGLATAGAVFAGAALPTRESVHAVAAFGLGTGGTACEAAAALTAPYLRVPLWVGHGDAVPAFVDGDTLVFVVSCGEGTQEAVAVVGEAASRGAHVLVVGGGVAVSGLADDAGFPWCPIVPDGLAARAALGAATVALLVALSGAELVPDCAPSVAAAAAALARRRDAHLASGGPAEELARRLGRTIPLVYGSNGIAAVAARWWKAQVNLNAKAPAFAASLPELTHDELAGWGQGGDVTRQTISLVLLRHAGEGPRAAALFAAVRAATDEVMADSFEVRAEGDDDLCRFFDLALFGELVSLCLAGHEGVDPGPVPAVDEAHAHAGGAGS
jgi:glucose/mannose-6-phosphate isomerase